MLTHEELTILEALLRTCYLTVAERAVVKKLVQRARRESERHEACATGWRRFDPGTHRI